MNELLNLSNSLSKNQTSGVLQASVRPNNVSVYWKDFDGAVDCGRWVHSFYQGDSNWFQVFYTVEVWSYQWIWKKSLKSATISLSVYLNWRLSQVYLMTRSLFWSNIGLQFVNMVIWIALKYPGKRACPYFWNICPWRVQKLVILWNVTPSGRNWPARVCKTIQSSQFKSNPRFTSI